MKITLLGKVPKGDEVRKTFLDWKTEYVDLIEKELPEAKILHGDHIRDDKGSVLVVGHDLWVVKNADVVIVDAREKIGAGTAQEVVMAKYFNVPLVSVIPKDTHHRRSNITFNGKLLEDWVHPFLEVCSDYVALDIPDAISWIKKGLPNPAKGISIFEEAIAAFETKLPEFVENYRQQGW